ncbi:rRNA maturation RNase YbeY [Latilactobacillus curvatus]|uniref:Endoribonuclease YbeY n=1 Tax=Latilactobacillus curvatus TaxID=28038 RepID=A0AAC9UKT2_LATCU|nr:rRNA maturation RNase YbeY [Latilactobacillus curvatus]ASN60083.1 rRNA maturation RNase YbeY [Latilactobacillus curvatus]MDG2978474.1 rRNA maturation RNase YbeY [Latilactobacillus curvatus]MDT3394891.1 rRNA maturation RNase YbeY [Bacillota bacterium]QAR35507.1 rRNA maturation RNase YbeY [Latilactobacillus curvatus]
MDIQIIDETKAVAEANVKLVTDILEYAGQQLDLPEDTEMSVTFVTNERIRQINKEYRDTDRATDVISFAIEEDPEEEGLPANFEELFDIPKNIGDLFVSLEKAAEQAETYGHSFERELGYTMVHGFLHLNGYDHIHSEDEAQMIPLQEKILDEFGLQR